MKITNVNDYVDSVAEKFPELSKEDIKRILVYGWKMILQYKNAGNDILVYNKKFFFFIGIIPNNALAIFSRYCEKLAKRIRFMFQRKKEEWDGYYYFSRTENQYLEYLKQSRKKNKTFKNVYLYKLLEEVKVKDSYAPYIFRISESRNKKFLKYYPELTTSTAELIIQRDPLKMKDILVSQNKFKYIN